MQYIPEDFLLDVFLFLIPFYFIFLVDRITIISQVFRSQGLIKKPFWEILKQTVIIFFLLFCLSYALGLFSYLFGVSDLELVGEEILKISPILIIYLFVIRVFMEEWFFRGFLTPRIGAIFSSALFAVGHFAYGSWVEVLGAFILGLFLAKMYEKTGNLWPNVFAHTLYNFVIYLFMIAL
ncbi:MAG: CPBP family intramembrane glutamic endopeptidase [archaeon]|jgi:hypothetical protein